jgi:Phage-related minor tail protein
MKALNLSFIISVIDKISAPVRAITATLGKAAAPTKAMDAALKDVGRAGDTMGAGLGRAMAQLEDVARTIDDLSASTDLSNDEIHDLARGLGSLPKDATTQQWARGFNLIGEKALKATDGYRQMSGAQKGWIGARAAFGGAVTQTVVGLASMADALDQVNGRMEQMENLGAIGDKVSGFATKINGALAGAVRNAASDDALVLDVAITADLTPAQQNDLAKTIRTAAKAGGRSNRETTGVLGQWVAQSGDLEGGKAALGPIMTAARATGATLEDTGRVGYAALAGLKIPASELVTTLDVLAYAGKKGGMDFNKMAPGLPNLVAEAESLGVTGVRGAASLAAALQIVQAKGQDAGVATNNLSNLMGQIGGPELQKRLKDVAGIDFRSALEAGRKRGQNDVETTIEVMGKLSAANKNAVADVFTDGPARAGFMELSNGAKRYASIRDEALTRGKDTTARDAAKRGAGPTETMSRLDAAKGRISSAFGRAMLPAIAIITPVLEKIASVMEGIADSPIGTTLAVIAAVIGGVTAAVGGLIAGGIALYGSFMALTMLSPGLATAVLGIARSLTIAPVLAVWRMGAGIFGSVFGGLARGARFVVPLIARLAGGLGGLALRILPMVVTGIRLVGIALMSNPIGMIIAGIALAATLILANWKTIGLFMKALWDKVTAWVAKAGKAIGETMDKAGAAVMGAWGKVKTWFADMWKALPDGLASATASILNILASPIKAINAVYDKVRSIAGFKPPPEDAGAPRFGGGGYGNGFAPPPPSLPRPPRAALPGPRDAGTARRGPATVNQTYHINGAASPEATSRAVARTQRNGALYD